MNGFAIVASFILSVAAVSIKDYEAGCYFAWIAILFLCKRP